MYVLFNPFLTFPASDSIPAKWWGRRWRWRGRSSCEARNSRVYLLLCFCGLSSRSVITLMIPSCLLPHSLSPALSLWSFLFRGSPDGAQPFLSGRLESAVRWGWNWVRFSHRHQGLLDNGNRDVCGWLGFREVSEWERGGGGEKGEERTPRDGSARRDYVVSSLSAE